MSILTDLIPAPIQGYLIAAAFAVLLGAFGWYTVHERNVEHAKDMDAINKVALVAKAKDAQIEAAEAAALTPIGVEYHAKLTANPEPNLGIVCHNPARPGGVPSATGSGPGADDPPDSEDGPIYDPSGPILTRADKADAQIIGLQQTINVLLHAMQEAHSK